MLNTYLKIPSACYFDDFPLFSPTSSAERTDAQVSEFLNLLGWRHSQTGAKGLPFAESFDVLGFTLNLDQLKEGGGLILENKPGRVDKMKQKIFQVKENGIVKLHEAQELHGLLNFACGYFAGRQLRYACQRIFGFVEQGRSGGEPLRVWCDELLTLLEQSKPRCIPRVPKIHSILIFTDGSYESHVGGLGACIFDLASDERFVFESEVPKNLLDRWAKAVGDQLICQIELFVMVLVRWEFRHRLAFRRALLFVDNEAARGAVIKGRSPSPVMDCLCKAFFAAEAIDPSFWWVERTPSKSNPSEAPSRGAGLECAREFGAEFRHGFETMEFLVQWMMESSETHPIQAAQ